MSAFQTVGVVTVVAIVLGAVAMFRLESSATPFFATFGNSLWWSLLTTTTLGFAQDIHPATVEGKLASMLLIGAGIVLVGTYHGLLELAAVPLHMTLPFSLLAISHPFSTALHKDSTVLHNRPRTW